MTVTTPVGRSPGSTSGLDLLPKGDIGAVLPGAAVRMRMRTCSDGELAVCAEDMGVAVSVVIVPCPQQEGGRQPR